MVCGNHRVEGLELRTGQTLPEWLSASLLRVDPRGHHVRAANPGLRRHAGVDPRRSFYSSRTTCSSRTTII